MSRKEIIKFLAIRTIGNFLLLFAIFGVLSTLGPALYYEFQYRVIQIRGVQYKVQSEKLTRSANSGQEAESSNETNQIATGGFANVLAGPKEQILIPPDPFFSVLIPKIGASSRVFPNVDPASENEFLPILRAGVAHAKGTVFPGVPGNTYLFAHSTDNFWDVGRYNAVFYLLKELSAGDDIVVFFENKRFNYKVTQVQVTDPSEVSYIMNSRQESKQILILQTCWPPGTSWKRLLVFAEPK